MRLVPHTVTGQSPRGADANEEIALGFPQHESDGDEQQAHERQHGGAHLEV